MGNTLLASGVSLLHRGWVFAWSVEFGFAAAYILAERSIHVSSHDANHSQFKFLGLGHSNCQFTFQRQQNLQVLRHSTYVLLKVPTGLEMMICVLRHSRLTETRLTFNGANDGCAPVPVGCL